LVGWTFTSTREGSIWRSRKAAGYVWDGRRVPYPRRIALRICLEKTGRPLMDTRTLEGVFRGEKGVEMYPLILTSG
jgi:hypothetical protein